MNKFKVILMMLGLAVLLFLIYLKSPKEKEELHIEQTPPAKEEELTMPDETNTRVVLKTNDNNSIYHGEVALIPDADYEILFCGKSRRCKEGEPFAISCAEEGYQKLISEKIIVIPTAASARTTVSTLQRSQGTPTYRGAFEIQCCDEGLILINDLPMEEYLYAVVPSEMPSDYPMEALKAQAICARTYAVKQMQYSKYTELGAHVDDSTSFQVYNNIGENETVNQAVDVTREQVVTYGGKVTDTYYFSTSCGYTTDGGAWKADTEEDMGYLSSRKLSEDAIEVWAVSDETEQEEIFDRFIRSADDSDYECKEPWYRWEMQIEKIALGRLDEKIRERYEVNPSRILTKGENGAYSSHEPPSIGELEDIIIAGRGDGGVIENLIIVGSHATIQILTEYNIRYVLAAEGASIARLNDADAACGRLLPSAFFTMDIEYEDDQFAGIHLYGGGYGHGTGMSQNCAKHMAIKGMQADQIIECFYRDIEIKELSEGVL